MSAAPDAICAALSSLATAFAADGYRLIVSGVEAGCLKIRVEAEPNACADCLIDKETLLGLVQSSLPENAGVHAIDIQYP